MIKKQYKVVADNLGEYSVLRPDGSMVLTEIQNKAKAELFCDELNELLEENKDLKQFKEFVLFYWEKTYKKRNIRINDEWKTTY